MSVKIDFADGHGDYKDPLIELARYVVRYGDDNALPSQDSEEGKHAYEYAQEFLERRCAWEKRRNHIKELRRQLASDRLGQQLLLEKLERVQIAAVELDLKDTVKDLGKIEDTIKALLNENIQAENKVLSSLNEN